MSSARLDRSASALRLVMIATLAISALYFVRVSLHWQLLWDSPVMHYVNFLMDHGMEPYREITDNNMPGAYLTERWAMETFGRTDLAWRAYEFFLLAVLGGSAVIITWPEDWAAGVYAAGMFLLLHAVEGPKSAVEREEVMTVLLIVSYAALFFAVRRRRPLTMLVFGVASGLAASIKPTVTPLAVCLLAMLWVVLRRRKVSSVPFLAWSFTGLIAVAALDLGFLLRHHALGDLAFVVRTVIPSYLALDRPGFVHLVAQSLPVSILVLVPCAAVTAYLGPRWPWERWALLLGAGFGALSYFAQQKGFAYHRYPFLAFLLLLLGLEFFSALRSAGGLRQTAAVAGLALSLIVDIPHYLHDLHRVVGRSELTLALESDLQQLGGRRLQRQVQCFDLVFGCLNSLYHLDLVEDGGFTGDLLFFSPVPGPGVDFYRRMYWDVVREHPANVLVISNERMGGRNSFDKLHSWPEFERYVDANFDEVRERSFPMEGRLTPPPNDGREPASYRIYVRRGVSPGTQASGAVPALK